MNFDDHLTDDSPETKDSDSIIKKPTKHKIPGYGLNFFKKTNNYFGRKIAASKSFLNTNPFYVKYVKKYLGVGFFVLFILSFVAAFIGYAGTHNWNFGLAANVVFVDALINNFIGITAILIGTLVAIGYRLSGRSLSDTILGFIKSAIGVLILGFGSGVLINTARPIFLALGNLGGNQSTQLIPLDPYFGLASSQNFLEGFGSSAGSIIYLALVIGFITNIALVALKKFTNLRTIFVTGHIMIQQAAIFSVVTYLVLFAGNGITGQSAFWGASVLGGLGAGIYWAYGSSLNYYATQKVTDNGGFAVGHQQMIAIAIAYKLGKYFGRPENDAENRRLSKWFRIFEDNIFTQSILIFLIFLILVLVIQYASVDPNNRFFVWNKDANTMIVNTKDIVVNTQKGNFSQWSVGNRVWWFTGFVLGVLKIVGSVLVIVYGVRMFVTELQQSFTGISERLIPNASVAVDIAATYGYAANSVTFGFLSGTVGQFMTVAILYGIKVASKNDDFPVVMPIFITLFFNSGAIGIYANKSGGLKAAIIVPFLFAIVGIFVTAGGIYGITHFFTNLQKTDPNLVMDVADKKLSGVLQPWSIGYNGMADPNIFFGSLNALMSLNPKLAFFWIAFWYALLLFLAQFVKYHDEEKQTYLYNLYTKSMISLSNLTRSKIRRINFWRPWKRTV